jgi:hypothetical protein
MDLNPLPLFPIPILVSNFQDKNHKLNLNLVEDIFEESKTDPKGEDHSNMGGWHSKPDLEIKYKSFSELSKIITDIGNQYCIMHGYKEGLVCSDLWANVNKSGDINFIHHHGTTALAGVYYPIESIVDNDWRFNYTKDNPIKAGTWDNKDGGAASRGTHTNVTQRVGVTMVLLVDIRGGPASWRLILAIQRG